MGWTRIQANCISRDWNDRRKFMGHFPPTTYAENGYPCDIIHEIVFASAITAAPRLLYDGEWIKAIIKNNSTTESIELTALTVRMVLEGIFVPAHITILPGGIKSICGIPAGDPLQIQSLGAEAECEVVLIGHLNFEEQE